MKKIPGYDSQMKSVEDKKIIANKIKNIKISELENEMNEEKEN